nr:ATP-binding protein [Desulfobaculum xiamenense]
MQERQHGGATTVRILIAEDEKIPRNVLRHTLNSWGHEVVEAADGREAYDVFRGTAKGVDMLITDWMMPEMDGLELARRVRRDGGERQYTYIILLTAKSDIDDMVTGFREGEVDDYVVKPFVASELEVRLQVGERLLALERRQKEINRSLSESLDELHRTQQKLVQSEKMASLGGLVAGVAHEINTPVGLGLTAASFLVRKTEEMRGHLEGETLTRSQFEAYLRNVEEASSSILANLDRAGELIRSFKKVAVDQTSGEKRRFALAAYIRGVLVSIGHECRRAGHSIQVECDEGIELESYPGAFMQILTNLVMNSLMHGFDGVSDGSISISARRAGGDVVLEYADDGVGMDEKTLKNIYEPFFTTKRARGGTGLGMQIVYNLVTQTLKGDIRCESAPGKGTRFTITVPACLEMTNEG